MVLHVLLGLRHSVVACWLLTSRYGSLTVDCAVCLKFPPRPTRQGVADDHEKHYTILKIWLKE